MLKCIFFYATAKTCSAARFPFLPSLISGLGPSLSLAGFALPSSFSLAVALGSPLPLLHLPHSGILKEGVAVIWERPLPFPWRLILPEQDVHLDITSPLGLTLCLPILRSSCAAEPRDRTLTNLICPSPNFFLTIGQPPTKMKAMDSSNDFKPDSEKRERERENH